MGSHYFIYERRSLPSLRSNATIIRALLVKVHLRASKTFMIDLCQRPSSRCERWRVRSSTKN